MSLRSPTATHLEKGQLRQSKGNSVSIAFVAVFFFLANLISRFPGVATYDGNQQYAEAVSGHFTDWHPPIMAWLWSVLRLIADGSGPLFTLHVFCYWLGFGLIAAALSRIGRNYAAWTVIAISILPPFLMINVEILKDVGLAVSFLASFAIFFWYRSQDKKVPLIAGIIATAFLLYGSLVRANGVFAAAPLLIYIYYPALFSRPLRFLATCSVIVAIAIPASSVFNHKILQASPGHPLRSLEIFDIAGVAYFSNDMSVFWDGPFTKQLVSDCYTPVMWDTLAHREGCHVFWDSPSPNQTRTWISAIVRHPVAYIEHRIAHFNYELDFIAPRHLDDGRVKQWMVEGTPPNVKPFTLKAKIKDFVLFNPLFTPIFALVLGLVVLAVSFPKPAARLSDLNNAALCLVTSGLFYMVGYLFVGVASDFHRYEFWAFVAIFIAAVICVSEERQHLVWPSRANWRCIGVMAVTFVVILVVHATGKDALFP